MALQEMEFSFQAEGDVRSLPEQWSHTGVVGSGDMEVLLRRESLDGSVRVKVCTPVRGFDDIWEKVLRRFVMESKLTDTAIEINDNNSTPYIVSMRLKQALAEALEGGSN